MKIKRLVLVNLFQTFTHDVIFNESGITIITAPNGYGKTVFLKVIDAIFNRQLSYLYELDFSDLLLETSCGDIRIEKTIGKTGAQLDVHLENTNVSFKVNARSFVRSERLISRIDGYVPFLNRVGPQEWLDERTDEIYSVEQVLLKFSEYLPREDISIFPEEFLSFTDSLDTYFIQDQRLSQSYPAYRHPRRRAPVKTIEKYANELKEIIDASSLNSSRVSQQLDSTFPVRLLDKKDIQLMNIEEIKNMLFDLQKRRSELSNLGLLSSEQQVPQMASLETIEASDQKVLTLYVQDTLKKLNSYDDIYKKIDLFSRILNEKRLTFKKVQINSEEGFYFETKTGNRLKLNQLSSGEQHQVVLLFELIFKAGKNTFVLIDEPEISLHIAWQKEFLSDLNEIISLHNYNVVIATHSPQIINSNWELTKDLALGVEE